MKPLTLTAIHVRRSIYGHLMVLPKDLRELNVRV